MKRQILLEYSNADFKKWANDSGLVARFRELKSRIPAGKPEADIGFWIKNKQPEDLAKFLDDLVQQAAEKAAKRDKAREGARLVYDKNGWRCYHITSYEAAARMGRGTRWCITGRYEGHESRGQYYFDEYLKSNYKAYYFLFQDNYKGTGKFPDNKWAICLHKYDDDCDIWQADDQSIPVIMRDVPSDIPEIPQVGVGRIFDIQDGVVIGTNARRGELEIEDIGVAAVAMGAHAIGDKVFAFNRDLERTLSTEGLSSIGNLAFASTGLTDVNIAKDTMHVGEKCFKGCKSLDYLEWNSPAPILNETFAACAGLTMIVFYTLPSDIAANAFANCPNINNITLPCRLEDCPENIQKVFESMESQPEFRKLHSDLKEDIRDAVAQTVHGKIKLADVYKNEQAQEALRGAAARDRYFLALDEIDQHNSDYRIAKSIEEVNSAPYYNVRVVLPAGTVTTESGFDVHYPILVLITQNGLECGPGYADLGIEVDGQFHHIDDLWSDQLIKFAWNHGAIFIAEEHKIDSDLRKQRRSNLGTYPHRYDRKFDGDPDVDDAVGMAIRTHFEGGPRVQDPALPNNISFQDGLSGHRYTNFEKTLNAATHTLRKELKKYRERYQLEAALNDINSEELYLALRIDAMTTSLNTLKDIKAKLRYFESAVDLLTAGLPDIDGVVSPNRDRSLGSYLKLKWTKNAAKDEYNDAQAEWDQTEALGFVNTKVRRVGEIVDYVTQVTATLDRRVQALSDAQDDLATAEEKFNDAKADEIDRLNAKIKHASDNIDGYNKQIQDLLNKVKAKRNKSGLKEDIRDAVGKNGVSLTKALDSNNSKYSQNWYNYETDDKGRKIDYHRSEYVPITPEEAFEIVKGSEDGYKQVKAVLPVDGKSHLIALTTSGHGLTSGTSTQLPDYMYFTMKGGIRTGNTQRMLLQGSEGLMHILKLAHEYGGLWKANIVPRDSETVAKRAQNPESPNFRDPSLNMPRGSNKEITKRHNDTPYGEFNKRSFKRRMDSYNSELKQYRTELELATQRLEAARQLGDDEMPPKEVQMSHAQSDIVYYTEKLEEVTSRVVWIMEDLMNYKNEAARRRYYDSEKQLQQNINAFRTIAKNRAKVIYRQEAAQASLDRLMNARPGDSVGADTYLYDVTIEVRRAQQAVKLAQKRVIESRADLENFDDIKSSLPRMSQQEINELFRKVNDTMAHYMELEAEMNDLLGRENQ